jgi:hypothetical protein
LATIISTFPMQNSTVWTVFFLIYSTHLQVSHRFRPIQLLPLRTKGYSIIWSSDERIFYSLVIGRKDISLFTLYIEQALI